MKPRLHTVALLCSFLTFPSAAALAQTTALSGARVIDGRGGVIDRGTVIVRDGKIVQVGPAASVTVPAGAERVDLAGRTLIPGLINAHGHLTNVVGMRTDPNERDARQCPAPGKNLRQLRHHDGLQSWR